MYMVSWDQRRRFLQQYCYYCCCKGFDRYMAYVCTNNAPNTQHPFEPRRYRYIYIYMFIVYCYCCISAFLSSHAFQRHAACVCMCNTRIGTSGACGQTLVHPPGRWVVIMYVCMYTGYETAVEQYCCYQGRLRILYIFFHKIKSSDKEDKDSPAPDPRRRHTTSRCARLRQ